MKDLPEKILKYVLGIVLACLGFMLTQGYARINENILQQNRDIVALKIQVTSLENKLLDEERIKEIVAMELLKHGIK